MNILAIDFGTSRIKAAYWDEKRQEPVMLALGKEGRLYVPSLFYLEKNGHILFGDEAERKLYHDPLGVIQSLKLNLDKPIQRTPNGQKTESVNLLAVVFRRIREWSMANVPSFQGKPPDKLILTLPCRWDYEDIYTEAAKRAGYSTGKEHLEFIREPIAAARAWIHEHHPKPGNSLVVIDFGGGTVDWACVVVSEESTEVVPDCPPGGTRTAGVDVDQGLFNHMMSSQIDDARREYIKKHQPLVMEEIRMMKEAQNRKLSLSSSEESTLCLELEGSPFQFTQETFDTIMANSILEQTWAGALRFVENILTRTKAKSSGLACILVGGSRNLPLLEEKVKKQINDIAAKVNVSVDFPKLSLPDLATVLGSVIVLPKQPNKPVVSISTPELAYSSGRNGGRDVDADDRHDDRQSAISCLVSIKGTEPSLKEEPGLKVIPAYSNKKTKSFFTKEFT